MSPLLSQEPTMMEKKKMYNYKAYEWQQGDRYNPTMAGVLSFLIPGVGQIATNEAGRGLAFLLPSIIADIVILVDEYTFNEDQVAIAGIASITLSIWSCIDAVRVAKVNNMYFRNKSKNNVSFKINPYTNILSYNNVEYGLSFRICFNL